MTDQELADEVRKAAECLAYAVATARDAGLNVAPPHKSVGMFCLWDYESAQWKVSRQTDY